MVRFEVATSEVIDRTEAALSTLVGTAQVLTPELSLEILTRSLG
jgi:hypothetical protein